MGTEAHLCYLQTASDGSTALNWSGVNTGQTWMLILGVLQRRKQHSELTLTQEMMENGLNRGSSS